MSQLDNPMVQGIRSASPVALLAASIWLITSAINATEFSNLIAPVIAVTISTIALVLFNFANRGINQDLSVELSLIPRLVVAGVGATIIVLLHPISGLVTLAFLAISICLLPRIMARSTKSDRDAQNEVKNLLNERIEASTTHQVEAKIFGYSRKLKEEVDEIESNLALIGNNLDKSQRIMNSIIDLIMGLNVITNGILVLMTSEPQPVDALRLTTSLLLPIAIFTSIRRLQSNDIIGALSKSLESDLLEEQR
jgi:ABC-type transport system involved in cytochrome bd biosynthesis fused ATPase/permease subunit